MVRGMTSVLDPPYLIIRPGFTEADFYRMADEDSDWEFLDGRIVMHSPASYQHENLFGFLSFLLRGFVQQRRLGITLGSRFPMRLDAQWSPEPDILVVRSPNRRRIQKTFLDGPADLVVEIASESDPRLDYREKLPRYRAAGVPEIWVVDPFAKHVLVESLVKDHYNSHIVKRGRLNSTTLAGFWLDAGWLWRKQTPSSLDCLQGILGSAAAQESGPGSAAAIQRSGPPRHRA